MTDDFKEARSNVVKVMVIAYTDKNYTEQDGSVQPFPLPINPESYSENLKVEYDLRRGHGNQGTDPKFKSTAPEELKLDFYFDGTNTVQGYFLKDAASNNVVDQVADFKNTVYSYNGDIHRPRFLKIFWGDLTFPCILTNLDINYTLFNENGLPLRAKISTTFVNYVAQEQRVARENNSSPDLTHLKQIKEGDRLDLMTYQIYKDPQYLMQVASANDLVSFRNIKTGSNIKFPPLDRKEV